MKIEAFTIKNYRSINELQIDNLNQVNVFFGKNNVGKSNILRGLHLAFYCLKNNEIFLPDTMFYNRNIYKPIEIMVDLILEEDFYDTEKVYNAIREGIENIHSGVINKEETFTYIMRSVEQETFSDIMRSVEQFIDESKSFKPINMLRFKMYLDYKDETSDIGVMIEDLESDYRFDYGNYKRLYRRLKGMFKEKMQKQRKKVIDDLLSELSLLGIDEKELSPFSLYFTPIDKVIAHLKFLIEHDIPLKGTVGGTWKTRDPGKIKRALFFLDRYVETLQRHEDDTLAEPLSKTFNIVKEYFEKISNSFILISNMEYFPKGPFTERGGERIEIFDVNRFKAELDTRIDSPGRKEREFLQKLSDIFSRSYGDLGKLEFRKFQETALAIFDTGFTALPIEDQGLGIQDLYLYLTHMILFDSAIIAIEEPEGGLSTENQKTLYNIIEDVYAGSDKQIFISSHSKEFETPNSYIIEMEKEGTKEISRREMVEEYEKKIEGILVNRRLEQEKELYEALLREVTEREITLDILNYISKHGDEEKVDTQKISTDLGYKKEKVEEVLSNILMKKTK